MFAGCLQIMWAHWQLIRVEGTGYLQLIRAEKTDVCRPLQLPTLGYFINPVRRVCREAIRQRSEP